MIRLRDLLTEGKEELETVKIADAALDAWLLLEYILQIDRSYYFLHMEEMVNEESVLRYRSLVARRKQHIPLQQLTQQAYFMGLPFYVNEQVLIPRQDTECLVEIVLQKEKHARRILDLCTGSGCILLSLLVLLNEKNKQNNQQNKDEPFLPIEGIGADISLSALKVAKKNAKILDTQAEFICSDLFSQIRGTYDIIVSNPPYIPTKVISTLMEEVREHEPFLALDGKESGLYFYEEIIREAGAFLQTDGWLCFEIGFDQGPKVKELLEQAGYKNIEIHKDLSENDRVALGQWN